MYTLNNLYDFILEATGRDLEGRIDRVVQKGKRNPLAAVRKAFPLASDHTATDPEVASFHRTFPLEAGHIPMEFAIRATSCSIASTNHSFASLLTS